MAQILDIVEKNRDEPATRQDTFWIQEIFYTLQGEGPLIGQAAVFIRLGGCNLSCFFCDTDFESSDWYAGIDEIVSKVESLRPSSCDLIVLTGGEPFRQPIGILVEKLLELGLRVQIETNGMLWVELPESERLSIVCSPKTNFVHAKIRSRANAFKFVIEASNCSNDDAPVLASSHLPGKAIDIERLLYGASSSSSLENRTGAGSGSGFGLASGSVPVPVYIMPMDSGCESRNRANRDACVELALKYGYRMTVQLHKILGIS